MLNKKNITKKTNQQSTGMQRQKNMIEVTSYSNKTQHKWEHNNVLKWEI